MDLKSLLKNLNEKEIETLFIQNSEDPACHADDLEDYLKKVGLKDYQLAKLDGVDHAYLELQKLKETITNFLGDSV